MAFEVYTNTTKYTSLLQAKCENYIKTTLLPFVGIFSCGSIQNKEDEFRGNLVDTYFDILRCKWFVHGLFMLTLYCPRFKRSFILFFFTD